MTVTTLGHGRYSVMSETTPGRTYTVQLAEDKGVCDCQGAEGAAQAGHVCKHVAAAQAAMKGEGVTSTALEKVTYAPMVVEPPSKTLPTTDELKVMVTIANSVYKTAGKLIPENIKTSEEAFAIMLAGHELGIPPMAAFREIYVVKGRTMPSARVLMGLVMKGDPDARFTWFERSAKRAHLRLTRGNGAAIEVEYSMEDATAAGLNTNDVWKKFPADMLAYKAVTRACRLGGADLITGIGAAVKGAPSVMAGIEDDDDMPVLEQQPVKIVDNDPPARGGHGLRTSKEVKPVTAEFKEAYEAFKAAAERLKNETHANYVANIVEEIKQLIPDKVTPEGRIQYELMTAEDCRRATALILNALDGTPPPESEEGG